MKNNFPKNVFVEHVKTKDQDYFVAYESPEEIGEIGEIMIVGVYELKELIQVKTNMTQEVKPYKEGK